MKTLFTAILVLCSTILFAQGIKKETAKANAPVGKPATAKSDTALSKIEVTGRYADDTVKVILIQYVEDGSLVWSRGYAVTRYFVPQGGQPLQNGQMLFDHKWNAVKPEDLYDARQFAWK